MKKKLLGLVFAGALLVSAVLPGAGVVSARHDGPHCNNGVGNGADCRPGMARFNNDDVGGRPGAPGARGGGELGTEY